MVLGKLAMWHYPITTLGPGKRVGVWFQGCDKNCKGCETPEFRRIVPLSDCETELESVLKTVCSNEVDGITISGGEPFLQSEALLFLVEGFMKIQLSKGITPDVLVYTGYTYDELIKTAVNRYILQNVSVLIDGPYIEELDSGNSLKGSENQRVIILDKEIGKSFRTDERRSGEVVWNSFLNRFVYIGLK